MGVSKRRRCMRIIAYGLKPCASWATIRWFPAGTIFARWRMKSGSSRWQNSVACETSRASQISAIVIGWQSRMYTLPYSAVGSCTCIDNTVYLSPNPLTSLKRYTISAGHFHHRVAI